MTQHKTTQAKLAAYTPRPDANPVIPDQIEFAEWCEHPITKFVASAFLRAAEAQQDEWTQLSWNSGQVDPLALRELKARADAYSAFLETTREQYVNILN